MYVKKINWGRLTFNPIARSFFKKRFNSCLLDLMLVSKWSGGRDHSKKNLKNYVRLSLVVTSETAPLELLNFCYDLVAF